MSHSIKSPLFFSTPRWRLILCALGVALAFPVALPARADTPTPYIPAALAPLSRETPVELVALALDGEIREINGRTLITGTTTFKLHNTDRLNDLQVPVGFPAWAGDPYTFDPARLDTFVVTVDNKKMALTPAQAELKIGREVRSVGWYTFTLPLAGDEKRTVRVDFQQDLGDDALPRFTYGLVTGGGWKGAIGSARITLKFPETTTQDQIIAYDPPDPTFDSSSITWLFQKYEPPANPYLQFIRPSLWSDLNARRRAAQQNPNDAPARAALGALLSQLALVDSPRRDGFFAQAIAESETALRLDGNNRVARQALAQLYELRAGSATGPRQSGYVTLAIEQWEALARNDASARRQLAEDYFYLGLDAQTRGAFADADAFYLKAQTLAPNGAGPLYLPERMTAQRRALNLFWSRALLEQNEITRAAEKARAAFGDAFTAGFTPPPFYIARGRVEMAAQSRTMTFSVVPYAHNRAELENALSGIIPALRGAGAEADFVADARGATLTVGIAFNNANDLRQTLPRVAAFFGERAEWSVARAVTEPSALVWNEAEELWARTTNYREAVDLSNACRVFSAHAQRITQTLAATPNTPDEESQIKRALFTFAQGGWQSALAQGTMTYRAGGGETRVEACAAQQVALSTASPRIERVILTAFALEFFVGGVLLLRWRRRR